MTDTFLRQKLSQEEKSHRPQDPEKTVKQQEYSNKMVQIMKEMQSPRKFNSPL
jgi:hypothetical protein